jgi:signal transduction histidine kinase
VTLSTAGWLVGGGEMGELIRSIDWSKTPLGPIDSWPPSLRTTVGLCLASNFPISIAWGDHHTQIYNDGYWPICGGKHPTSMGQDFTECWASAWPVIGDAYARALAGHGSFLENQRMFLDRNGYLEETFFTFSFSPIRDEEGKIGGLFHPANETTAKNLSERRTRTVRDLGVRAAQAPTVVEGFAIAARTLAESDLELPFTLFYILDESGTARLVASSGLRAGTPASPETVTLTGSAAGWPFRRVAEQKRAETVDDLAKRVGLPPCGPYSERPLRARVLPILRPGGTRPMAFLVLGLSSRLPFDDAYRFFCELVAGAVTTVVVTSSAYEEVRKRADALAEVDRAKTAFFSNVSHEFRTPLTLMIGALEDALADRELPGHYRDGLTLAHRNSLRLLRLVNTLLDFSRIEAGRAKATYEPLDLPALTMDLASSFRAACEQAGLHLVVRCSPLPEPVFVDRDMYEKIVLNLLSNAFKFTFAGEIEVKLDLHDGRARLTVRDTGVGIPSDELPRVFDRFHRAEGTRGRSIEGSGIGLSLVKELVALHGGEVTVSSVLGEGSAFTVTLPFGTAHLPPDRIAAAPQPSSTALGARPFVEEALRWLPEGPEHPPPSTASSGDGSAAGSRRPRVIVADDNADMRDYLRRLLSRSFEVEATVDGQVALEAARRRQPDVVLTDVMMPRLDGFGLIHELRADPRLRTVPVVVLSARAGEEARGEGLEAGADDYLVKPFAAPELLARVQTQLDLARVRRGWEAELAQANAELEAFSYSVSHDLRAPLRTLSGFSQAILEDYSDVLDARGKNYLRRIHDAALRMGNLIDEILKLSRLSRAPVNRRWLDLASMADEIVASLRQADPARNVEVEIVRPLVGWGDRVLVEAVLTNLLENAWKFTSHREKAHIRLASWSQGEETVFVVHDDGAGFDMRFAGTLFGPFQRLHAQDDFPGTGVGLATVRRILHRLGGEICPEAEVDRGASFYFTLGPRPNMVDDVGLAGARSSGSTGDAAAAAR